MRLDGLVKKIGSTKVKKREVLAPYVNMRVGGPADLFVQISSSEELERMVKAAIESEIPYTIIGNGANVLVSDAGVRGLVIKNSSRRIKFFPFGFVEIDSGVNNPDLIAKAKDRNLTGLERLLKVPGTIGGAVYMNAGDTGRKEFFGDLVEWVRVIDKEGEVKKLNRRECEFGYRSSRFQASGEIILKAKIGLRQASKGEIEAKVKDILVRKMQHPSGATVGSTFKNPDYDHAGKLIEQCGLKGKRIGGAKISEKHANFIINEGNATTRDVKNLIDLMKRSVKEKFNVDLEEEVRYVGDWS